MKIEELQKRLHEKEQELLAGMSETELEARSLGGPEVQDRFDSAESKEAVFQQTTSEWKLYNQVREALQRIKSGSYGKCLSCGQPIEENRLKSVPWAAYCLLHQGHQDRLQGV